MEKDQDSRDAVAAVSLLWPVVLIVLGLAVLFIGLLV
jgi:hypothetical protein